MTDRMQEKYASMKLYFMFCWPCISIYLCK